MIEVGDAFPEFELQDDRGIPIKNSDLMGKPTVIYFYPKDNTPGCTLQACAMRDHFDSFAGFHVFGVSPDSVKKHVNFREKHKLNFPLLADVDKALATALGLWNEKTLYGRKYFGVDRTTYLLDADGNIAQVWRKVNPLTHAKEVREFIQSHPELTGN